MRNPAGAIVTIFAAVLSVSVGMEASALGIIGSLPQPASRPSAASPEGNRLATTLPTAAGAVEAAPASSTNSTRFDATDGLFAFTLPPGWTMLARRDRSNAYGGWTDAGKDSSFALIVWPSDAGIHARTILRQRRIGMDLVLKDFRVIEETDFPLGPLEGAKVVVEGTDKSGVRLRLMFLVAKNDQRTLEFSLYGPAEKFELLGPGLEALLKSFELTGTIVESANGKFNVMLPPGVKLVQDPKFPDRQHCRLSPDAELLFDVYRSSAIQNAASIMAHDRSDVIARAPDYRVLEERKAPATEVITGMINGHMRLDEWSQPDGSRWRSGAFYYDTGNLICTFNLYAKADKFTFFWPTAQRIAASYRDFDLVAAGSQSGLRSITAASGDFEVLIPENCALDPVSAEHIPHFFRNYRACEETGMNSFAVRAGTDRVDQGLDIVSGVLMKSAQEIKVVQESDIKLGKFAARERIVDFTRDEIRYRVAVQCCVQEGRSYQLWFRTPIERYPFMRPIVDKMLASFALLAPVDLTKMIPYENKERHFRCSYPDALRPEGTFGDEVFRIAVRPAGPAVQYLENVVFGGPSKFKDPTLTLERAATDWEKIQMGYLTGPKPKGWEDTTVGGIKAKRIVYDMTVKGLDGGPILIRKMVYLMVRDGRSFSIRVQGRVPAFPVYFATAQKVIDSFEWTSD